MEEEMSSSKQTCSLLQKENEELQNIRTELEGSNLENSVLFSGIAKWVWETFTDCRKKVLDELAKTVRNKSPDEADKSVQNIALSHMKRVGIFSKNRTRPVSVKFVNQSDKHYLMEHKKLLPKGIYVEDEFTLNIQWKRNVPRLVLKLTNQKDAYKGKYKLDADTLVITGIKYMVNNISELPEEISVMKATQKMNEKTLCYFGELSPFSNLHACRFHLHNTYYHFSEQYIEHANAKMFRDKTAASTILNSQDGFEAKM